MHAPFSAFFGTRVSSQASPHDRGTLYLAFLRNPNHKAEDYAAALRRLQFPAGGSSLYPLAKVPAESGGGRRWHRRCQLPGSGAIGGTIGPL